MALSQPDVSRESLIERLRRELLRVAGDDQSICRLAAERGIFCHGFSQFSDADLRQRLHWIAQRRPDATRAEMEDLGDRWQLARQEVDGLLTSCDVQKREQDLCGGWDDFTDEDLLRFYNELSCTPAVAATGGRSLHGRAHYDDLTKSHTIEDAEQQHLLKVERRKARRI
jgi:hypothetical protein